jgi:hypothetical protein
MTDILRRGLKLFGQRKSDTAKITVEPYGNALKIVKIEGLGI